MPDDLLPRLAAEPRRAAILLDVDGTLAPIVSRPEDARVPDETRSELARLASRYALVACVSGRAGAEVERLVGVPGVAVGSLDDEVGGSEQRRRRLGRVDRNANGELEAVQPREGVEVCRVVAGVEPVRDRRAAHELGDGRALVRAHGRPHVPT